MRPSGKKRVEPLVERALGLSLSGVRQAALPLLQSALFRKYVALISAVMAAALVASSLIDIWFTWRDHRSALVRIQQEQAAAAATRISQFIREIEGQLGWMTHLSWAGTANEQRELDAQRLMRQVPAITELSLLDAQGREQLRVSRQEMDRVGSNADLSNDERFKVALASKVYFGPVYFRRGSEPFMTLAVAGARRDAGVTVAEVNLTHIWDVINTIRVGRTGRAFVLDGRGRLLAHPDISLVLRYTDVSQLAQVRAARGEAGGASSERGVVARDIQGARVLTAHARAEPLGWLVFVELPEQEANEPLYEVITRSVLLALAGLVLALLAALLLAQHMVVPIRALTAGAARIGAGALDHRIAISSGDELEALGRQFNDMAARLQASYATLERKVEERTRELQAANLSKSRFLAVASHDLRQPLHALNLLVAQLRSEPTPQERARLALRVDAAVANMNDLFNALLDVSRLDAGALEANVTDLPVGGVLARIEATFAAAARDKGLHLVVVPSGAWVRSDAILLERILLNLVSNAVRYTQEGGVVVGCRRRGGQLRIDVCDSGFGIPKDQQRSIFEEFYRVGGAERVRGDGLGLGLAIVERLCALLGHEVSLASTPGRGSRFSVLVPSVPAQALAAAPPAAAALDPLPGKLVAVIDDDALALEGTAGLLARWGCRVVAAESASEALARLIGAAPDLIISDFRLGEARTGVEAIAELRKALGGPIPAFLISGDIAPETQRAAKAAGLHLINKPVSPMALRAMMTQLLKAGA